MPDYRINISIIGFQTGPADTLLRLGGLPLGVTAAAWPRFRGRPMQHAFTIDLQGLELDCERARGMRALAVFVDSLYELEPGSDGIKVLWLDQRQVDATPQPDPPQDYVPETFPGVETSDDTGTYESWPSVRIEAFGDGEARVRDSYIGGEPVWGEVEAPRLPGGAFVLSVARTWGRGDAALLVFEEGGVLHPQFEWKGSLPWREALDRSRLLEVRNEPPATDALQKWGGIPRGVRDWPQDTRHILTWALDEPKDDMVAIALFGAPGDASPQQRYTLVGIYGYHLEDESAGTLEAPAGVEVLEERALSLVPLHSGVSWRDLERASFVGPRAVWRSPDKAPGPEFWDGPILQLDGSLLPGEDARGTLYGRGTNLIVTVHRGG